MFLVDCAEFAKKKDTEKRVTLRDRIIGTTNAGKAFRVGALVSGAGLAGLALKNRNKLSQLKKPLDYFSTPAGSDSHRMEWRDSDGNVKKSRQFEPGKKNPSFISSGRKVNWGRVGKTAGVAGTALAIPTGAAYLAADKKEKDEISRRTRNTIGATKSTLRDVRTWINTLHRVSR